MPASVDDVMIHPLADVKAQHIGSGTTIWQFCVVMSGAKIGMNCNINAQSLIENDVILGDNVTVKSGVQLWDGLRVADNVFIGPNATFTNDKTPRSKQRPKGFLETWIGRNASIGANSTVLGGVTIGAYSLVGAGSVITENVPEHALVYGNPAVQHGYVCECGKKLSDFSCESCGNHYEYSGQTLIKVK